MCNYLGVPIAQEKTSGPSQVIQFAGITLDSINQEARLPEDKLQKCRLLLVPNRPIKKRFAQLLKIYFVTGALRVDSDKHFDLLKGNV